MTKTEHTKTGTWRVGECRAQLIAIKDGEGRIMAEVPAPPQHHAESEARAAFIVRACNLHEELVGALRRALDEMGETVAADCAWCGGEGSWTDGANPKMVPVRHRENCPILVIRAVLASADAAVGKGEGR